MLGITATKEGKYSEALDYFRKAEADPKMAQEATFQASLALAALNRVKEAKRPWQESIALNPQSQTADFAQRYMGVLTERAASPAPLPHHRVRQPMITTPTSPCRPGSGGQVTNISGKGGSVFTQTALMEYTLLPAGPFSVLGQYAYFQNFHPTVQGFDIMSHFMGLTPTYGFKNGRFWFPIATPTWTCSQTNITPAFTSPPRISICSRRSLGLEFGAKYNRQYYSTPVFLTQDNRSGKAWGGNVGLYYFFKKQKGFVQARLGYVHNNTTGNNWDSSTYSLLLSLL